MLNDVPEEGAKGRGSAVKEAGKGQERGKGGGARQQGEWLSNRGQGRGKKAAGERGVAKQQGEGQECSREGGVAKKQKEGARQQREGLSRQEGEWPGNEGVAKK